MIKVNGQTVPHYQTESLCELLERLNIKRYGIAVEINEKLIPLAKHASTLIADDDRIEIVSLVGGG